MRASWAHFTKKGRTWKWCWHSLSNDCPSKAFNGGQHYVFTLQKSHKGKLWVTYKPIKKGCLILSSFGFKSWTARLEVHQVLIGGHKHCLCWYSDIVQFANIDGVTWPCQASAVCTCTRFQSLLPLYYLWYYLLRVWSLAITSAFTCTQGHTHKLFPWVLPTSPAPTLLHKLNKINSTVE